MGKIRVGVVNYLNTRPLIHGIKNHPVAERMELTEDYPSRLASMLLRDEIDLGLVPVAAVLEMKEWHLVGNYCIGTEGEVASVCLFSEVPVEQIEKIYLDYQSRTSVGLLRILMKEYWKQDVVFEHTGNEDFRENVRGTSAALVIGDRAFEQRLHPGFIYDLGLAWKEYTGLPFVFAAWIANKPLSEAFEAEFDAANAAGVAAAEEVAKSIAYDKYDLGKYYRENIDYRLSARKRRGMEVYLEKLHVLGV